MHCENAHFALNPHLRSLWPSWIMSLCYRHYPSCTKYHQVCFFLPLASMTLLFSWVAVIDASVIHSNLFEHLLAFSNINIITEAYKSIRCTLTHTHFSFLIYHALPTCMLNMKQWFSTVFDDDSILWATTLSLPVYHAWVCRVCAGAIINCTSVNRACGNEADCRVTVSISGLKLLREPCHLLAVKCATAVCHSSEDVSAER